MAASGCSALRLTVAAVAGRGGQQWVANWEVHWSRCRRAACTTQRHPEGVTGSHKHSWSQSLSRIVHHRLLGQQLQGSSATGDRA